MSLTLPLLLGACLFPDEDFYQHRIAELTDADGDGFSPVDGDCDDADAATFPSAAERCDGLDQDCDEAVDEEAADAATSYADADADTFGAGVGVTACVAPAGHAANALDCDDASAAVNPSAGETAYDGVDDDCDGEDLTDVDGDGYDAAQVGGDDCDDADAGGISGRVRRLL